MSAFFQPWHKWINYRNQHSWNFVKWSHEDYCCLHLSTPRSFFSSFFIFLTSIFCSTFSFAAFRSAASLSILFCSSLASSSSIPYSFHFFLCCISFSSIFVHLILQFFGILIVHPIFFPQLLHHCRCLLVAFLCWLLLLNPIFVTDILTHLFPLIFLFDMLLLSLILCFFLSNFPFFFLLQFFLTWRNLFRFVALQKA